MYSVYFLTKSSDQNWQRLTEEQSLKMAVSICHKIVTKLGYYCARVSPIHHQDVLPREELKMVNQFYKSKTKPLAS